MPLVQNIEVEGFKGLKSLSAQLNTINIITGRNNTGKTSLLEAIDLGLNPYKFQNFTPNVEGTINIQTDQINISLNYRNQSRDLNIRKAGIEEGTNVYTEIISDLVGRGPRYWIGHGPWGEEIAESIRPIVAELAQDRIATSNSDFRSALSDNVYMITYDGETYPFIFLSDFHIRLGDHIAEEQFDEVLEKFSDETDLEDFEFDEEIKEQLRRQIRRIFQFQYNEGFFLENPPGENVGSFIRTAALEGDPRGEDDEKSSVKKTQIRDYLSEHQIIPRIQDFDFNEIVVEDSDGSRYALDYEYMGDGFKSIIGILWQLIDVDSGTGEDLIMLEEPENHLHPGYIDELVPFLVRTASEGNQLFMTTHNIDFISAFFSDELEEEYGEFLIENLTVIQMTESIPDIMPYETAGDELDDMHKDLRGV